MLVVASWHVASVSWRDGQGPGYYVPRLVAERNCQEEPLLTSEFGPTNANTGAQTERAALLPWNTCNWSLGWSRLGGRRTSPVASWQELRGG